MKKPNFKRIVHMTIRNISPDKETIIIDSCRHLWEHSLMFPSIMFCLFCGNIKQIDDKDKTSRKKSQVKEN